MGEKIIDLRGHNPLIFMVQTTKLCLLFWTSFLK